MSVHKTACLRVHGRALLVTRVGEQGWRVGADALAAGVSVRTAHKWLARHRAAVDPWLRHYNHPCPRSTFSPQPLG